MQGMVCCVGMERRLVFGGSIEKEEHVDFIEASSFHLLIGRLLSYLQSFEVPFTHLIAQNHTEDPVSVFVRSALYWARQTFILGQFEAFT